MSKRRVSNNFQKWLWKSLPFFLIVFFIFFNTPFFIFNGSVYENKNHTFNSASDQKFSRQTTFDFSIGLRDKEFIKSAVEVSRIETGDYPLNLEDIAGLSKNKNWVYTMSPDRYILEYRHAGRQ